MAAASTSSSLAIQMPTESELKELPKTPANRSPAAAPPTPAQTQKSTTTSSVAALNTTLTSVASLMKLLPSGTVLAFQALAPSFTDKGQCSAPNKYLTAALLSLCAATLVFFTFTDSLRGNDGKLYYGLATLKGMYVFNYDGDDGGRSSVFPPEMSKYKVRVLDYVHAFFGVFVFLSVAFSDAKVQNCYFENAGENAKEAMTNLALGSAFFSGVVFIIFPTTRKGIGYSDAHTTFSS